MKRNVVLVDYKQNNDWDFIRGLEDITNFHWDVEFKESSGLHGGVKSFLRYFSYFSFSFRIFWNREKYERIIAWQQFFGLIISFYCKLFGVSKSRCPKIYVMELIYKPKKGILGKIYEKFVKYCVNSPYITKFTVYSAHEKKHYELTLNISEKLIETVSLGIEDCYEKFSQYITDEHYYMTAGRSNRDYKFLLDYWPADKKLLIICDNEKLKIKNGMEQLQNCYMDDYYQKLAKCHGVVIPLKDKNISSGQLVILQAMMFGKPVVVTDNKTVREYLIDREDGYVINDNEKELLDALDKMENKDNWLYLTKRCREHFILLHSMRAMGNAVGKLIK